MVPFFIQSLKAEDSFFNAQLSFISCMYWVTISSQFCLQNISGIYSLFSSTVTSLKDWPILASEVYWPEFCLHHTFPIKPERGQLRIMSLRGSKVWEWWVGEMLHRDRRFYKKSVSDDTRQAGFQILSLPLPVVSSRASSSLECNLTVFDFEIIIHTS